MPISHAGLDFQQDFRYGDGDDMRLAGNQNPESYVFTMA